jgi:hypothetical protein
MAPFSGSLANLSKPWATSCTGTWRRFASSWATILGRENGDMMKSEIRIPKSERRPGFQGQPRSRFGGFGIRYSDFRPRIF